jgi:hypothetical protein
MKAHPNRSLEATNVSNWHNADLRDPTPQGLLRGPKRTNGGEALRSESCQKQKFFGWRAFPGATFTIGRFKRLSTTSDLDDYCGIPAMRMPSTMGPASAEYLNGSSCSSQLTVKFGCILRASAASALASPIWPSWAWQAARAAWFHEKRRFMRRIASIASRKRRA